MGGGESQALAYTCVERSAAPDKVEGERVSTHGYPSTFTGTPRPVQPRDFIVARQIYHSLPETEW